MLVWLNMRPSFQKYRIILVSHDSKISNVSKRTSLAQTQAILSKSECTNWRQKHSSCVFKNICIKPSTYKFSEEKKHLEFTYPEEFFLIGNNSYNGTHVEESDSSMLQIGMWPSMPFNF